MLDLLLDLSIFRRDGWTPDIAVWVDGVPVSDAILPRIGRAEITDATGRRNDTCELTIDNGAPRFASPRIGAKIELAGGYKETARVRFGSYKITEVSNEGPPPTLQITAKAFDDREAAKGRRMRAYENTTLGQVYRELAGRMGLQLAISPSLASIPVSYLAQRAESDWHLAARLADRHNASSAAKDGRLVVAQLGEGQSVTGRTLPEIVVMPHDLAGPKSYRAKKSQEASHGRIVAPWHDRATGRLRNFEMPGTDGSSAEFLFRNPFQNEQDARRAAEGKQRELGRSGGQLWCRIYGRPTAQAEATLRLVGVDPEADGEWSVERVRHIFQASAAYITEIEAVPPKKKKS